MCKTVDSRGIFGLILTKSIANMNHNVHSAMCSYGTSMIRFIIYCRIFRFRKLNVVRVCLEANSFDLLWYLCLVTIVVCLTNKNETHIQYYVRSLFIVINNFSLVLAIFCLLLANIIMIIDFPVSDLWFARKYKYWYNPRGMKTPTVFRYDVFFYLW